MTTASSTLPTASVFVAVGAPALVAALTTALVGWRYGRAEAAAPAAGALLSLNEAP